MSFSFIDLVNTSISASWLVLAVILMRLILKKAPKAIHCALWALVAIRLLCPFSIESEFSLIPSAQTVSDYYLTQEGSFDNAPAVLDVVENPIYPDELDVTLDTKSSRIGWLDVEWSAIIWPAGMAAMAIYAVISYLRIRRRVSASVKVGEKLYLCDYIDSPFILGIAKPGIYLPSQMEQQTLDHVVAHEMAHLKRRDHWWKPLGFLLLSIHWFNPVMWVAYILLCRDIELACDEKVIRDMDAESKKAYSSALLACSVRRPIIAACPLAFGEVSVKNRVKNVLHYRKPAFWIIVVAVVLCAAVAVCFLTDPLAPNVWDIMYQDGYTILTQCSQALALSVPANAVPESAFSETGCTFHENEVVVYRTDTTTIWLMNVQYANEGDDKMYFEFNISNDLNRFGTILLPDRANIDSRATTTFFCVPSQTMYDGATEYPDAVSVRAIGPDCRFTVYIDTEAVRAAQEEIRFDVMLNQLTYAREGKEPEIFHAVTAYDQNYQTWDFNSDDIFEFRIGVNKRGQIAFYRPYDAFTSMTELYADAIAYLQAAYDLDPLMPMDYLDYKTLGWQTETGDEALNTACTAVSQILDIYENSFSETEGSSDIAPSTKPDRIADGVYQSEEVRFWNPASSTLASSVSVRMLVADDTITVTPYNTAEVELGWQRKCPLSDTQLAGFYEFYSILGDDPILGAGCVYQPIDENHFLAKRDGEIYLVNWRDSEIGLEVVWYILRMVPTE